MLERKPRLVCEACQFVFYQNSKPCVGAIILERGKVLLTKRAVEPFKAHWDIPGGFLEEGEAPEAGLKRELMEELGLTCRIKSMIGIVLDTYGKSGEHTFNLYYKVEPIGKPKWAADDIS